MKNLTAQFENQTTEYKGNREVTYGWLLTLPCGNTVKGFSLDEAKAYKTANSAIATNSPIRSFRSLNNNPHAIKELCNQYNCTKVSELKKTLDTKTSEFAAKCKIEVAKAK